jgi:lambda family phage portal protein
MVNSIADYVVGTGPRLQVLTGDPNVNRLVEKEFTLWAIAVGLAHKLHTMRVSQSVSGEVFAQLTTNPKIDAKVQLDVLPIEADRVTEPWVKMGRDPLTIDGIEFDEWGNPSRYHILQHHPGSLSWGATGSEFDVLPADFVVHLFRVERPGQHRGVSEIAPALTLFAFLRRYTLAVVTAAEQAALVSGAIQTDAPPDEEAADVKPLDEVEMDRGTWLTMPQGWKAYQIKAEQPTTTYGDFKRQLVTEIARSLNMPYNFAAGDSSDYNYASGRLDHQAFFKTVGIDQRRLEGQVMDPILRAWIQEAILVSGFLPQSLRMVGAQLPHQWLWDGVEHVDPMKEARAQETRLESNTTTLAAEYGKQGKDWETEVRQRAREVDLVKELGLDVDGDSTSDDALAERIAERVTEALEEAK